MASMVAVTAAAASGLPANVEECSSGSALSGANSRADATTPPTGITPPPRILPVSSASGVTPARSAPHQAPSRPMPDWISSRIITAPAAVHARRTSAR